MEFQERFATEDACRDYVFVVALAGLAGDDAAASRGRDRRREVEIDECFSSPRDVRFVWIKGHAGGPQQHGVTDVPGVVLADAGYWHQDHMDELTAEHAIQVLIPPDASNRTTSRPGWKRRTPRVYAPRPETDVGKALYRRRRALIEPVFGHTKFNRRIDRFQRRRLAACRSEWRLIAATHNLTKLHRHHLAALAA